MRAGARCLPAVAAGIAATLLLAAPGPRGAAEDALAQSVNRSQVRDVLAQLRRNASVSERLNAAFFRAPQTRQYVGTAFRPLGAVPHEAHPDYSVQLRTSPPGCTPSGPDGTQQSCSPAVTSGTFHLPLDVPNRARVVGVSASYRDAAGNNNDAPSGLGFSVLEMGLLGDDRRQLLDLPAGADPALGYRSRDGGVEPSHRLPLDGGGFTVDNSRRRYVLQVRIDDGNENTRFHGITVRYVLGATRR